MNTTEETHTIGLLSIQIDKYEIATRQTKYLQSQKLTCNLTRPKKCSFLYLFSYLGARKADRFTDVLKVAVCVMKCYIRA